MTPSGLIFAAAALLLLARVALGPLEFIRSPLNAESVAAVTLFLTLLYRANGKREPEPSRAPAWLPAIGAVIVIAAFLPGVTAPLVHDGYSHIGRVSSESWTELIRSTLVRPAPGDDPFFRPLAYITYWIDSRWAGFHAVPWHLWNLAVHLVNCALVWILARRLALGRLPAGVAALIFALHGTRPEVVSWAGARFDLLATLFVLAALLAAERMAPLWMVAVFTALALLSKESAFTLPLLIALLILFKPELDRRRILQSALTAAGVCAAFLIYRTWFLGGIGGYTTISGTPSIFEFNPILSAKALFYRQWGILFFPINWSAEPGIVLKTAAAVMLLAAALFLQYCRARRRFLAASLAFVIIAVLPAQHLLLIGADLSGARILYLPAAGLALFWGFALEGIEGARLQIALAAGLLAFQITALEHNLRIWRNVAIEAQRICRDFGREIASDPRPVVTPRNFQFAAR